MKPKQTYKEGTKIVHQNEEFLVIGFEPYCCEYCIHAHSRYILEKISDNVLYTVYTHNYNGEVDWASFRLLNMNEVD